MLQKAGLKDHTEALSIAAQEQALSARAGDWFGFTTVDETPGEGLGKMPQRNNLLILPQYHRRSL